MGSDTAIAEGAIADTAIDNSILEKNDTGEISQDWQGIIHYSLAKEVTTVRGIWVEYVKGINGGPPVKFLEEKFNHRWRLKNQSSTYNRRKRIYKAIEYAINVLKLNEEDVIEELEKYRYDPIEQKKRPMYWLYDNIPSKFKPNFLTTTTTNN
ncbi:hypothetical protein PACTADRAFT_49801 [Pachysolen tannophilus NRRL Y-2460]|uniref:Transcription activator GCR1-like domain-containing protein n=1 Tax=Pachysolen tannophilus NRRL Y-2460 TaxID=669874 RepID=A0A1E4TXJ4_PACTA|nr:hypothetical protein PACTADRAFT_49801 [Pachysolen tannophilus NRRL Y-2460]